MKASAVACVRHLIQEYRRFLRTSYRFLDDKLREQFERHLAQADVVVRGPLVTLSRDFEKGSTLTALVEAGVAERELLSAHWPFGTAPIYRHQEEALKAGRQGRPFIVTTGTGSGKTESFLLPVLDGVLRRKREGITGVQAILLYPMNALANDQLERLRRLLRGSGLDISFALYTGDSDNTARSLGEEPAEQERLTRADIRSRPPDLLLTNYKQLEFLLIRAEDRVLFTPALKYLVLDELHSYRGALATEIACLLRRLKAHAHPDGGVIQGIGTSATVATGEEGARSLAEFATVLYGSSFNKEDIISEHLVPVVQHAEPWIPSVPPLLDEDLTNLNYEDDNAVVALAERLTGRRCQASGPVAARIGSVLAGNKVVSLIEGCFSHPAELSDVVKEMQAKLPTRASLPADAIRREIEAYLLVGSIGDEDHPPRLRPKLHTFFHGVYDVSLCLNPDCRSLVPHGGTACPRCGSAARPAALCRTCGQDFIKVRFEKESDDLPVGTGDFYSDERTAFLTPRIHALPEGQDETEEETEQAVPTRPSSRRRRQPEEPDKLGKTALCTGCGRIVSPGATCSACNLRGVDYFIHKGALHTCPVCGDSYPRGDIVTPLRTGTASTVSALVTHHLDLLYERA